MTYYVGKLFKEYNVKNREELIVKVKSGGKMLEEWNYTESESGRSETLIKAIEKIEMLEKKLAIATDGLNEIKNAEFERYLMNNGWTAVSKLREIAKQKLKEITDVE